MRRILLSLSILLVILPVTATGQINLSFLRHFQDSPITIGARLNASWLLPNRRPEVNLTGEAIFPVLKGIRTRISVVDLQLNGFQFTNNRLGFDSLNISANSGLSLDLIGSTRLKNSLWPYAWLGPELYGRIDALRLNLRLGIGVERPVQRRVAAFGEAGIAYGHPLTGSSSPTIRARLGVGLRLGRFKL